MGTKRVTIGDIFEIPLSDGRKAYAQYVYRDPNQGPLIQVFDYFSEGDFHMEAIHNAKPLFPPVITGIGAAVKTGLWKVVGHIKITNFIYPHFISTDFIRMDESKRKWYLWDGEKNTFIGNPLPEEYKHMEPLIVWAALSVVDRIETGKSPLDMLGIKL